MYHRILLPTDGSPGADPATDHALDLAREYDAALYALYVVDTDALPVDSHAALITAALETEGRVALEAIVDRAHELGVDPVVDELREGTPHEEILAAIDDHDVDLVVMGTHGRRGLDRYVLGSVTERVLRLSDVPVLTVRQRVGD